MPGSSYPITYNRTKVVRVNMLEFNEVLGNETSRVHYCGSRTFEIGEQVTIKPITIETGIPIPLECYRYITAIIDPLELMDDDYVCTLKLNVFKPDRL